MWDNSRWEDTDRYASTAVVTATLNGTRVYLNEEGTATDIKSRAKLFRDYADASIRARRENADGTWWGYMGKWEAKYTITED